MAFDEALAGRVRKLLANRADVREVCMFGGLCFTVGGNMCCGIAGDDLMVRLGEPATADALREPGVRPMDFTGRPSRGMVFVAGAACAGAQLRRWVQRAVAFAAKLPPKAGKASPRPRS